MQVLFVEPDLVLAKTYCQALEGNGWQVSWAPSAQAALDAADSTTPDVVVLELQLVEHSGIEFLYEFRSYPEWQDVPVIIHTFVPSTAFADLSVLEVELGAAAYHYKPNTNIAQLMSSIRECAKIEQ